MSRNPNDMGYIHINKDCLIQKQREYIEFLENYISSIVPMLATSDYNTPIDITAERQKLIEEIKELEYE
jgi:F420-dependent methylenetetrahydromethanopterin dehydrogenase